MSITPRRRKTAQNTEPTWQDNMPAWSDGSRNARYMRFTEIDRWRAIPYDMPPDPERGTVMQRVRQITESLSDAIDEGSGQSLDLIIESWVAGWIATVETAYADHRGVISVHRNQAAEWLAETSRIAEHENQELELIREAYLACRARLAGEPFPGGADGPQPGSSDSRAL